MTLAELPKNNKAIIIEVTDKFLIPRGFIQFELIEVVQKYPLLVRLDKCQWGLDSDTANNIIVERV